MMRSCLVDIRSSTRQLSNKEGATEMHDVNSFPFVAVVSDDLLFFYYKAGYLVVGAVALLLLGSFFIRKKLYIAHVIFLLNSLLLGIWVSMIFVTSYTDTFVYFASQKYAYWIENVLPYDWYIYVALYFLMVAEGIIRRKMRWYLFASIIGIVLIFAYGYHAAAAAVAMSV